MDQSPTVANSPIAAKKSTVLGGVPNQRDLSDVHQNVNPWPKAAALTKSELDSILIRLVERVHYITGATGAAIGLLEGTEMVCRATSGTTAPDLGVHLETWKGLSGECIRTGQTLRCENVEFDKRVEVESCQRMGVQSIVVTPVRRNNVVVGIFELFSSQPYAFQDRDVATLQRIAELVKRELERRPLVVDAAYVRLPDYASYEATAADDQETTKRDPSSSSASDGDLLGSAIDSPTPEMAVPESHHESQGASVPCRNCGAGIEAGRLLCPECGSLQADPEMLPVPQAEEAPVAVGKARKDRNPFSFRQRIRIPKYSVGVILAMLALFVAFVPIHTNQVDAQSPAAAQAAQDQSGAPAASGSPATVQGTTSTAQPLAPAGSQNTSPIAVAPAATSASVTPATGAQSSSGQEQSVYASPPSSSSPQPAIVPIPGNPLTASTPASSATNAQTPVPVPTTAAAPLAATPHAGPAAQPESSLTQPKYEAPPRTTRSHQNEPWFIARVSNAIDSFEQMFQPPPDPGPTAEQLGDPRVVVWVDLTTGLYYCPGASTYGKTEKGKFLTQKEAHAEYFTSAIRIGCK